MKTLVAIFLVIVMPALVVIILMNFMPAKDAFFMVAIPGALAVIIYVVVREIKNPS